MAISKNSFKGKSFILLIGGLFLLLASLAAGVYLVSQRTSFFGHAYDPALLLPNPTSSYLFASPLTAVADGKDKIKVTVVIINSRRQVVVGSEVSLLERENMIINALRPATDDLGVAVFEISATTPGEYSIEAVVDEKVIEQKVKVNFTEGETSFSGFRNYLSNFIAMLFGKR